MPVHAIRLTLALTLLLGGLATGRAAHADEPARLVRVTASDHQTGNTPRNTLDDDAASRWAAEGAGNWIAYAFDRPVPLEAVEIGFVHGDQRVYRFDLEVSDDGQTWRRVFRGESAGESERPQRFTFDATEPVRHVRYVHRGNSVNAWANMHTFRVPGVAADLGPEPVPAITGPTGLVAELWADESLVAAPIAISVDPAGRIYLTQTTRRRESDLDIRNYRDFVPMDMSFRSVDDRRRFYHEMFDGESEHTRRVPDLNEDGEHDYRDLMVKSEYVHVIEDTSGDGRADRTHVFADGFNTEVTGVAGGVLWHDGSVYLAVAPDIWKLDDTTGDGVADERRSISHGYGVHIAFAGHDVSGMRLGPDGRVYWGLGDIGFNVTTDEGRELVYPNQGAILRAEADGSNVEVFAAGLRNTHEFDFDQYGNLFTVDNDGDMPNERERTLYVVEGGDYGWRSNWQYRQSGWTPMPHGQSPYNPWLAERLFHPQHEGQAAYVMPAIDHYSDGPTGFIYNPGTALSSDYRDFFFLSQFPGEVLTAFRFERDGGAGYRKVDEHVAHRGLLVTGLAFGPDGALYLADWIEGWVPREDGRIWRLDAPDAADAPLRRETQRLIREGMGERNEAELVDLLAHADMRVRREAQFELARRDELETLLTVAADGNRAQLARVHAMWGIGQIGRREGGFDRTAELLDLLADEDDELRAQAARLAGDIRHEAARPRLIAMLEDASPRVQFHAAIALGKIGGEAIVAPAVALLARNDGRDPYLRHAGVMMLVGGGDATPLVELADHDPAAVRLAAVVALRRLREPGVSDFLADADERVAAEAARAIHDDFSIPEALDALAVSLSEQPHWSDEALLRRAINANLRVGEERNARLLAAYAARADAPEAMRVEALATLGVWANPPELDRVEGRYRALQAGEAATVRAALAEHRSRLIDDGTPAPVRTMLAHVAGDVRWEAAGETLLTWVEDASQPSGLRLAALDALGRMGHAQLGDAVSAALQDDDDALRSVAQSLLGRLDADAAAPALAAAAESGTLRERQAALASLAELETEAAAEVLAAWMQRLIDGDVPDELALDVLQAARARDEAPLAARVQAYERQVQQRQGDDPLAAWRPALAGGDAERGEQVFLNHPAAACIRCHTLGSRGGDAEGVDALAAIAPDLATVGDRRDREELLAKLINPNAAVTPGYGTIAVTLDSGRTIAGALRERDDDHLVILTTEGETVRVARSEVRRQSEPVSMMPPMGAILNVEEMRDVVEFLTTLREQ